jgi:response regulator NasT
MTQTAQQHSPAATAPRGPATTHRKGTAQNPMGQHRSLLLTRAPARDVAGALSKAGIDVVGQAATTEDAVGLSTLCRPDTLLVHVGNDDNPSALFAGVQVELPLVVLAESADPELIRAAVAAGALAYVVAPFTPERLIPALEMAGARNAELAGLRATVTDIKDRLDTRKIVERAKGLLMAHERLTEQDAFRFIQRTAMDRRSSMRDVANAITQKIAGAA